MPSLQELPAETIEHIAGLLSRDLCPFRLVNRDLSAKVWRKFLEVFVRHRCTALSVEKSLRNLLGLAALNQSLKSPEVWKSDVEIDSSEADDHEPHPEEQHLAYDTTRDWLQLNYEHYLEMQRILQDVEEDVLILTNIFSRLRYAGKVPDIVTTDDDMCAPPCLQQFAVDTGKALVPCNEQKRPVDIIIEAAVLGSLRIRDIKIDRAHDVWCLAYSDEGGVCSIPVGFFANLRRAELQFNWAPAAIAHGTESYQTTRAVAYQLEHFAIVNNAVEQTSFFAVSLDRQHIGVLLGALQEKPLQTLHLEGAIIDRHVLEKAVGTMKSHHTLEIKNCALLFRDYTSARYRDLPKLKTTQQDRVLLETFKQGTAVEKLCFQGCRFWEWLEDEAE